ncbi:hypothetical protein ACFZB5_13405 [Streptomyces nodosus]|uniref:hypothetical protein n=1 Tax=Streptomyces nodosus TaxID=40318 RepID=UPI0036E4B877
MPVPEPAPEAAPLPSSQGPGCSVASCVVPPLVQWQRRPTEDELDAIVAVEQSRRDQALAAADPQQPPPVFGPLPTQKDILIAVFACGAHAISMDLAALVHAANCTAPDPAVLPGCNCTPEAPPEPEPLHVEPAPLPDHWA